MVKYSNNKKSGTMLWINSVTILLVSIVIISRSYKTTSHRLSNTKYEESERAIYTFSRLIISYVNILNHKLYGKLLDIID